MSGLLYFRVALSWLYLSTCIVLFCLMDEIIPKQCDSWQENIASHECTGEMSNLFLSIKQIQSRRHLGGDDDM